MAWKLVLGSTDDHIGPMKKHGCSMVSFKAEGRHHLLTIGGTGPTLKHSMTATTSSGYSHHAEFIPSKQKQQVYYTNELWAISVSDPPGLGPVKRTWISLKAVGDHFSPRAYFSANTLPNNQAVIFGGQVVTADGQFERSDDLFLAYCSKENIEFKKISKSSVSMLWPCKRYHHATTIITSHSSMTDQDTQHLVVLGGCNDKVVADCWILNIESATWSKIDLPDSVTCRHKHSLATLSISTNLVWIVVSGGFKRGSTDYVSKKDNFVLVKLVFTQETAQWSVSSIFDSTRDYHNFLHTSLLEGRLIRQGIISKKVSVSDVSSEKKLEDIHLLTHRLESTERDFMEIQKQRDRLEQQIQSTQKEEIEKRKLSKQKDEDLKTKDKQIRELTQDVKRLREKIEEMKHAHQKELDEEKQKNDNIVYQTHVLEKNLQNQVSFLQEENIKSTTTMKKHEKDLMRKEELIASLNMKLANSDKHLLEVNKSIKTLKTEKVNLEKLVKSCVSEKEIASQQLQERNAATSIKHEEVEMLKQKIQELETKSEKVIAENSHQYEKEIKRKVEIIEEKSAELKKTNAMVAELKQQLEMYHAKAEKMEKAYKDIQKITDETHQWMVDEEEVKLTDQSLGKGSYGEVNVAIFRGTKVAAKRIHTCLSADSNYYLGIFMREMDLSSKMHHPNIVQFIGATNGSAPILMYELMETSLHSVLLKQQLSNEEVLHVTRDILSALAYLHAWKPNPIIHRDISSPNVLMEHSGTNQRWRSKLSDFGSANLQRHTKTEWPGNLHYAAPEAKNPNSHTPLMDIYSFGILLVEMAINKPPEPCSRKNQIESINWDFMKTIVHRCVSADYSSRPQAIELLEELNDKAVDDGN